MLSLSRVALHLGALLLVASAASAQTTWYVPGDFPDIQAAIDASQPGDTVLVDSGVHPVAELHVGKAITLASIHGANATVLDGQDLSRILSVTASNSRIEGFTFWRGHADGGGALRASGYGIQVVGCVFRSNRAKDGADGVAGAAGVASTTLGGQGGIGGNGGPGAPGHPGGAVYVETGEVRFVDCSFFNNRAGRGGHGGPGGPGGKGGPGSLFMSPGKGGTGGAGGPPANGAFGGAIGTLFGVVYLDNCSFRGNRAGAGGDGGAVGVGGPGGSWLLEQGPQGNSGSGYPGARGGYGGALAVVATGPSTAGKFFVTNCVFIENQAGAAGAGTGVHPDGDPGVGAAVFTLNAATLTAVNSIFRNNSGTANDIAWFTGFTPTVWNCVLDFSLPFGWNNLVADPLLVFGSAPWSFPRLAPGSPCIDAADGSALGASVTLDALGNPRRVEDPATPNGPNAGFPPLDIGPVEFVPSASVTLFDCAFNPTGSLTHVSGSPTPGGAAAFALDNPLATQGFSAVFALVGFQSFASEANPCGLAIPGFGMGGPGALGGLAADPNAVLVLAGLWNQSGPLPWTLGVPNDLALLGLTVTLQGVFTEIPSGAVPIGLTRAARVVVGA